MTKMTVMNLPDNPSKAETAAWMGYDTIEAMDRDHDALHMALADSLRVESMSMKQAKGETLTETEQELAWIEENAVLNVQRWMRKAGVVDG